MTSHRDSDLLDRLRAVAAAAAGLVGADRFDALQDVLRDELSRVVPFDAFTFALYDPATDLLHFESGRDAGMVLPQHVMPLAGTPSEQVVRSRRSSLTGQATEVDAGQTLVLGTGRRSESVVRTPILAPDRVLGVISVQSYDRDRYTADDVEIVETIAALAATAILNIQLLDERRSAETALRSSEAKAQRLAGRMRAAAYAASELIEARTLESLQSVIRDACAQVISLDYCTLGLYDPETDSLRFEPSIDGDETIERPMRLALAGLPSECVVRERRSLVTLRSDDPASHGAVRVGTGRRSESVIRAPVVAGDRVLGVLSVQSYTPDLYHEDDVEVIEAMAALAATAILNIEYLAHHKELEAQLRQAQKMEAVGRLAGGVAHDFNNLLTAIQGNAALVLSEMAEADPHRLELEEITEAAERAAELTRQLLAFGRQQVLLPHELDLNEQIEQVQGLLQRLLPAHISVRTALDPELGKVRADRSQMDQVLLNLAVNARDAMPAGGEIVITTRNAELDATGPAGRCSLDPGRYVVLSVADSGVGMDEPTLAKVFEPFFSTKPHGKGTGLGLAMVYGIVQQSDGCVIVDSEPGAGSTFTIYLPRARGAGAGSAAAAPRAEPAPGGSETILLVEDEAAVRQLARRILERKGYTVLEAKDGEEALRLYSEEGLRPDLVLTDVMMPRMGGHLLAAGLRSLDPSVRIVFMSGYAGDVLHEQSALAGMASFVQKPFTLRSLTEAVREALDLRSSDP